MVADSGTDLTWLRWVTPLGWIEELQPLTYPRPFALVPIACLVVVLGVATVSLAGAGISARAARPTVRASRRSPPSDDPFGLGVYLFRSTLVPGRRHRRVRPLARSIAKSGGKIITSSASLRSVFARLGVSGAEAYLGVALLIMSVALTFVAVGQVSAARKEESSGQLDNLLVRPLSRATWIGERIALGAATIVVGGLLAGIATWVGAVSDHAHVTLSSMLGAGINVSVPALVLFGLGVLALAVAPRVVNVVTYGLLCGSSSSR